MLKKPSLEGDRLIAEGNLTASAVVRLAKLQAQGWAYIKP